MKLLNSAIVVAAVIAGALASETAFAHGRARFGVFIGGPIWGPSWYYPYPPSYYYPYPSPYYYPYPPAASSPPTYIEKGDEGPEESSYWYYCPESKAYYPYVKECPGGWQRVSPQPPSPR